MKYKLMNDVSKSALQVGLHYRQTDYLKSNPEVLTFNYFKD